MVLTRVIRRDERRSPASKDKDASVDRGRGRERGTREAARETRLPERAPQNAVERTRPGHSSLDCDIPLDDEVGADKRSFRVVEQNVQEVGRAVKGEIREHPKRLCGKLHGRSVRAYDLDVRPAPAETSGQGRIDLDCEDAASSTRELLGQSTGACSDHDDEVGRTDVGTADELSCERVATKEVLATR